MPIRGSLIVCSVVVALNTTLVLLGLLNFLDIFLKDLRLDTTRFRRHVWKSPGQTVLFWKSRKVVRFVSELEYMRAVISVA